MGEMITTRDPRIQQILDNAQQKRAEEQAQRREWARNWASLKKKARGVSLHPMPVMPAEHDLFSNVLADNAWVGQRCFIIGGGPSLKDFDFSKLEGELVIGVNRAYERVNCTIMFATDAQYRKWIEKGELGAEARRRFDEFKGHKVWLDSARYCHKGVKRLTGLNGHGLSFSMKAGLHHGGNSGYGALNLAVCLGANPIYLLGFDMKGKAGKQAWWHDGYPKTQPAIVYKKFKTYFESAVPILKEKGIRVVNLSPDSALTCFEFGKFEDIRRKAITAITPTGDRPLAFALCQQWMKRQTRQPDQWIVVDDGKVPLEPSVPMQYVRREPRPNDPQHTLILNLKTAMPLIKGDKIVIIEDDEYYAPEYIEEMARRLNRHEVVGIMRAKYYHLPTGGYFQIRNTTHASLAETGFRSSVVPEFSGLWDGDSSLDMRLWQKIGRTRSLLFVDTDKPLYLGIKGLPGRTGIGAGHNPALYRRTRDTADRAMLRRWVPQDYQVYLDILNGKLTSENYRSYFLGISDITGVTVVQDTKDLIERAYNSIRKFHPDMPIVIIDGSTPGDPCDSYVKSLASDVTTIVSLGYNIGHGRGLCMGIDKVKTPYALIFDSDIEMLKSPVQSMLEMMEEDTFGVGYIEGKTAFDGFEWGWPGHNTPGEWMSYLHPMFQLIDIRNYRKFHPYVHHGAPCYLTMLDIHKRGLSDKVLKQFPGLGHSSGKGLNWTGMPREHIRHDPGSTSKMRTGKNARAIEGGWVRNEGLV